MKPSFALPDLRFEQTFYRQLAANSTKKTPKPEDLDPRALTDEQLREFSQKIDEDEQEILGNEGSDLQPLEPVTPALVIYTILKDQMFFPLLQGFLWTGVLISMRPVLQVFVRHGQLTGHWLANMLGLNSITRRSLSR
ncbi:uncharacterized protein RJT20DRAFT_4924 [Scheffersomyces xylosifermentans]|uniref:uncharacterized protein n=1 Tax=Scheffersomyces xylosifermentans TaxID=1304137 RepID=UPI00315D5609